MRGSILNWVFRASGSSTLSAPLLLSCISSCKTFYICRGFISVYSKFLPSLMRSNTFVSPLGVLSGFLGSYKTVLVPSAPPISLATLLSSGVSPVSRGSALSSSKKFYYSVIDTSCLLSATYPFASSSGSWFVLSSLFNLFSSSYHEPTASSSSWSKSKSMTTLAPSS